MRKKNRRFASDYEVEELAEQLNDELTMPDVTAGDDDMLPIDEGNDFIAEAEELLAEAELPDEQPIVGDDEEDVLNAAEELEEQIQAAEDEEDVINAAEELEEQIACMASDDDCPDCGTKPCRCAGIEDEIGDEAHGGDSSVSCLYDTPYCNTDKEVYGQNTSSAYVARITKRLDRVATALEKRGMKKMAFRVDQLSDRLEAGIRKHR